MNVCHFCTGTESIDDAWWEIACPTDMISIWICCNCMTKKNIEEWLGDKFANELAS